MIKRLQIFFLYSTLFFLGMWIGSPQNNDDARAAQITADIVASMHR